MDKILKGNYPIPDLNEKVKKVEENKETLQEEFEAAASKQRRQRGLRLWRRRLKAGGFSKSGSATAVAENCAAKKHKKASLRRVRQR